MGVIYFSSFRLSQNNFKTVDFFHSHKKALRIITFSKEDSHASPLFKSLGLIKFFDIALFQIAACCIPFFFCQFNKCS